MVLERFAISLLIFCAGCGQDSGNPLSGDGARTTPNIQNVFNLPLTDLNALPTGTARYIGSAAFGSDSENIAEILSRPEMTSDLNLIANFQSGNISATFNNFKGSSGSPMQGLLQADMTQFNENFLGSVHGNIGEAGPTSSFSGDIFGRFRGSTAEFFAGTLQISGVTGDLYGAFAAQDMAR
jgi:hypothetical protein